MIRCPLSVRRLKGPENYIVLATTERQYSRFTLHLSEAILNELLRVGYVVFLSITLTPFRL